MFRSGIWALTALATLTIWAEPAQAQRFRGRWGGYYRPYYGGYYHNNYGWGGNYPVYYGWSGNYNPGYVTSGYAGQPYYVYDNCGMVPVAYNTNVIHQQPMQNTTSMYGSPQTMPGTARVRVTLPQATARLWVDGQLNHDSGTERVITSPQLNAGASYSYTLKATWIDNGREITREKKVDLIPGRETAVSFLDSN